MARAAAPEVVQNALPMTAGEIDRIASDLEARHRETGTYRVEEDLRREGPERRLADEQRQAAANLKEQQIADVDRALERNDLDRAR